MTSPEAAQIGAGQEGWGLRKGLTTSQIKWIALFFMTLDHLAAYGFEIPLFGRYYNHLRMVGRIAAPLFLFALVQGLRHTRSKPRFILRLYLAGMGAGLFVTVTVLLFGDIVGIITPGNIMFTFFYVALYVWAIERLMGSVKARNPRAALVPILCCVLPFVAQTLRLALYELTPIGSAKVMISFHCLLDSFLPTFVNADYGWEMIALGVLMYFAGTKWRQCIFFGGFCLVCIVLTRVSPWGIRGYLSVFVDSFQCWMVLALPFMLLYNGRRGNAPKWFFYGYYPIHRYVISVASAIVQAVS